jgi:hypothetical protein
MTQLKTYYKTYTSILKKVICEAKLNCNRDFIMKAGNEGKAIWKVIKSETGKKSDSTKKTIELLSEDYIIKHSYEFSEKFNNYFANIATDTGTYPSQSTFQCAENTNSIFLYPVTA